MTTETRKERSERFRKLAEQACAGSGVAKTFAPGAAVSHWENGRVSRARVTCPECGRKFASAMVRYQSEGVSTGRNVVVPQHKREV